MQTSIILRQQKQLRVSHKPFTERKKAHEIVHYAVKHPRTLWGRKYKGEMLAKLMNSCDRKSFQLVPQPEFFKSIKSNHHDKDQFVKQIILEGIQDRGEGFFIHTGYRLQASKVFSYFFYFSTSIFVHLLHSQLKKILPE